jgi:hypothetical protein
MPSADISAHPVAHTRELRIVEAHVARDRTAFPAGPRTAEPTAAWLAAAAGNPAQAHTEWGARGVALLPLGRRFDAVRIPEVLVRAALRAHGTVDGPMLLDPGNGMYYALVPPRSTETWACAFGTCLGRGAHLGVPHPSRLGPPGAHWVVPPCAHEPSVLATARVVRELVELGRREVEGAAAVPREQCGWCKQETGRPVKVGLIHGGSGGGGDVHACPGCVAAHRLLALADHPADSDGTPRRHP